jgi:MOSC domain-containing protein YiiM
MPSIVSVNVGLPREVEWRGRRIRTAIGKHPVPGSVRVGTLNFEGDGQGDLAVHGGKAKAVYAYPSEHYAPWRAELGLEDLGWGAFGENLTTIGLDESSVRVGDRLRIGTALLEVTRPRLPCYKLQIKFKRQDMIERFLRSGRTGFYLSVVREGHLAAGNAVELTAGAPDAPTIAEVVARKAAEESSA